MDEQNNPIAHQFDQMITASTQAHHQQIVNMMNRSTPAPAPVAVQPVAQPQPAIAALQPAPPAVTTPAADYWFLNQPVTPPKLKQGQAVFASSQVVTAGVSNDQPGIIHAAEPNAEEIALGARIKASHAHPSTSNANLKTILPIDQQLQQVPTVQLPITPIDVAATVPPPATPVPTVAAATPKPNPAVLELANNNDLNVATIARQAQRASAKPLDEDEEVIITLH